MRALGSELLAALGDLGSLEVQVVGSLIAIALAAVATPLRPLGRPRDLDQHSSASSDRE